MTPTDEATFIALWTQGLSHEALAQRLGCPVGTIKSRAHRLQQQGVIQPRPRGRGLALGRRATAAPVQQPVQDLDTDAVHTFDTGAVQAIGREVDQLKTDVQGLHHLVQALIDRVEHPPVQTPVQITTLPPYQKGKAVRWNLWILDAIRDELSALAAERGVSPSQPVQEVLWQWLSARRAATP
jgi:transposase